MTDRVFEDAEADGDQDVYDDDAVLAPTVKVVPHATH